jgi:transcriptional regulator with XRE-family HTH domain
MKRIDTIDQERRLLDVSQKVLCEKAKIAPSTYVRIKHGQVSPTERTLDRLANALAILKQSAERVAR